MGSCLPRPLSHLVRQQHFGFDLVGAISVVLAALAGYALSRYTGWGMVAYSRLLLVKQMFPLILALIPLFVLFRNFRLD